MRVYIKEKTGRRFCIPVPLALFRVGINIAAIWVRKSKHRKYKYEDRIGELENINFVQLSQSLQYLKGYRGMKIVEVKSKDGDEVTIIL
jgi:hypothetical protein